GFCQWEFGFGRSWALNGMVTRALLLKRGSRPKHVSIAAYFEFFRCERGAALIDYRRARRSGLQPSIKPSARPSRPRSAATCRTAANERRIHGFVHLEQPPGLGRCRSDDPAVVGHSR